LGELAAGVAHEIRNPLGAMRLYNGLLRERLDDPKAALGIVEKIDAGIHAVDCVVRDALALAPRGGRLEPRSLREIVEGACDTCRAVIEGSGVEIVKRYDDFDVQTPTDGTALSRVFVNLIANAAQASPAGATVSVLAGCERDGYVRTIVRDEGVGLPENMIEKIFEPFFTTKQHGTGLGLTIAHRLVEAHGGSLLARNRPEGGAEFTVTLPTRIEANEHDAADIDTERTSAALT